MCGFRGIPCAPPPGCLGYGELSLVMFAWVEFSGWRERGPLQRDYRGVPWTGWEPWGGVHPAGTRWPGPASSEIKITNRVLVLNARKNATKPPEPRSTRWTIFIYIVYNCNNIVEWNSPVISILILHTSKELKHWKKSHLKSGPYFTFCRYLGFFVSVIGFFGFFLGNHNKTLFFFLSFLFAVSVITFVGIFI